MMTHDDIQADLPLLALGSLDPEERREIEQHLGTGCDACERELANWRAVVEMVPLALEPTDTPDLKPTLLARARRPGPPATVTALPSRSRRWLAVPLAAAAVAALAFAWVRETSWRSELAHERQAVASLRAELEASAGKLEQVARVLAEREKDVATLRAGLDSAHAYLTILQTRGLQLVRLKQTPDAQPAEGHAIIGHAAGRALFYAFDLPAVAGDKTYELWWITEKEGPLQAGLFVPGADGLGRVEIPVPANAGAIKAAAVTIEPAGGRPKPTGPMVLLGTVEGS
jgi:anti-sigma-K factor RskA